MLSSTKMVGNGVDRWSKITEPSGVGVQLETDHRPHSNLNDIHDFHDHSQNFGLPVVNGLAICDFD